MLKKAALLLHDGFPNDNLPGELAELGGEGVAPAACPVGGEDGHLGGSQQAT